MHYKKGKSRLELNLMRNKGIPEGDKYMRNVQMKIIPNFFDLEEWLKENQDKDILEIQILQGVGFYIFYS